MRVRVNTLTLLLPTFLLLVASPLSLRARQGMPSGAPLRYTTTWLGNSFGGGPRWVQNFVEGMYVAPDGTIFAASRWDEAGREFGLYKNGDVIGQCADTHGWGTGGGLAVTASDRYIFIAHSQGNEGGGLKGPQYPPKGREWYGVSRRSRDGSHAPFPGGRGRFGDMLVLHEVDIETDAHVRGLAIDSRENLYISDTHSEQVRVYNARTMQPVRSFSAPRPGPLVFDKWGTLWILQAGDETGRLPRVLRCSPEGRPFAQQILLGGGIAPTALAYDAKTDRLLVADNGPAQQIRSYTNIDQAPRLSGTFGEEGGVYGGRTPGQAGPRRFSGPTGVGVDAAGNLYVGCNQPAGGAILRAFSPQGKLLWELLGLEFVDTAAPVPESDGTDVFTTENRYALNWSEMQVGRQWRWRAQTVDPFRYPNDPRLHEGHHDFCSVSVRKLGGRRFLIVQGMFQHALVFYRLDGEIAVPSVMFSKGPYRNGGWAHIPQPEKGRWIWRDANGDGDFQAKEFNDADGAQDPESWAWWVDERGGVWQGDQTGENPIRYFPLQGFDRRGNPIYSRASSRAFPLPAPMNHLLRIEYHPATDTMYLTGHTTDRPKTGGEWGQVGSEALRFDGWMKGGRTPRWRIALPYDPETHTRTPGASVTNATIKSFCTAGDYAFAVESRTAKVHVYRLDTGEKVGEMTPGPEVFRESGWVDFPDALRALRRKNGEYLIFVEEDWKGKVIIYRWKPEGSRRPPPRR